MDSSLKNEIWNRLQSGSSLDDLGLSKIDGFIDLRELDIQKSKLTKKYETSAGIIEEISTPIEIHGVHWVGLDCTRSKLPFIRFHDCIIENCKFDGSFCQDWRGWNLKVLEASFRSADLRGSVLGPVQNRERNLFKNVDFSNADLRRTVYVSLDFINCRFSNSKLSKVDFQGAVFENCIFDGMISEVLFYKHAFSRDELPCNEMSGVDFRNAQLHFVEFRNLDMSCVKWPEDGNHILLDNYKNKLQKMINSLDESTDPSLRGLNSLLRIKLKWAGANQEFGIISKYDVMEFGGENAWEKFLALIQTQ